MLDSLQLEYLEMPGLMVYVGAAGGAGTGLSTFWSHTISCSLSTVSLRRLNFRRHNRDLRAPTGRCWLSTFRREAAAG